MAQKNSRYIWGDEYKRNSAFVIPRKEKENDPPGFTTPKFTTVGAGYRPVMCVGLDVVVPLSEDEGSIPVPSVQLWPIVQ